MLNYKNTKPITTYIKRISNAFFTVLLLLSVTAKAQGDLLLFPKRIVFEGAEKSQTLNLANSGKDTVRYIISVVQIRMKKDGSFENITQPDSGQNFADKYFRIFPRSVVLAPNEAQTVKIQLTNTAGLPPGEYRSHIYFRSESDKKPLGEDKQEKSANAISVNLVAVFGISIPVIIRVGTSTMSMSISKPAMEWKKDTVPSLQLQFNRNGNMSSYGDVVVDHISPEGKTTRVAVVKGMAVYTPTPMRQVNLLLATNAGVNYHSGKLHITYTAQADTKPLKMAEAAIELY